MQLDLQGLEITKGELKHLSGVSINAIFRPPNFRKYLWEVIKTFLIIVLVASSCFLLILSIPQQTMLLVTIHTGIAVGLLTYDANKIFISQKNRNLIKLFDDVDRYNHVIKAIDINDQIESAGNPEVKISEREKVIEALRLTREDLIRALKTERIFRENESFIRLNPDLFANNLSALTALQVSNQAGEHGRIMNEALKIAMNVQKEMKQLQNWHSKQ